MNLYWITTEDHEEDWFIIATNVAEAEKFFEKYEDYNPGDATAEAIMAIPEKVRVRYKAHHPHERVIRQLGGTYLQESPRTVQLNGRTFQEGTGIDTLKENKHDTRKDR